MSMAVLLDRYLREAPAPAFDWGAANCCHFVSRWILAATGHDPMQAMGLRVTATPFDAKRLLVELGGGLEAAWTKGMGRAPIAATLAQIGDVVLVPLPCEGGAVGICIGRAVVCIAPSGALVRVDMCHASHAWRIEVPAC